MGLIFELKGRLKSSGMLILMILLFFYFGFYAFYGERGFRKYLYLSKEIEYARGLSLQYKSQKENLNKQVRLISPESLDLDLLEERVRLVLNYVEDDEFIILEE